MLISKTKKSVFLIPIIFLMSFSFLMVFSVSASARTWSGIVVDAVSNQPIANAEVKAGVKGRVDAFDGYKYITDSSGRFSITWPAKDWGIWKADTQEHHLRFEKEGYFEGDIVRGRPEEGLIVTMTPLDVHIKGQLIDGKTGQPVPNVRVCLGVPGRTDEGNITDHNGMFSFKPIRLFSELGTRRTLHDYPASLGVDYNKDPGPYYPYELGIDAGGDYISEAVPIPVNALLPSIDGSIYTFVTYRVQQHGDPKPTEVISAEIRGLDTINTQAHSVEVPKSSYSSSSPSPPSSPGLSSSPGHELSGDPFTSLIGQLGSVLTNLGKKNGESTPKNVASPSQSGISPDRIMSLVEELRAMLKRAEAGNSAHPNFIADLYRWLSLLEKELETSNNLQWGNY